MKFIFTKGKNWKEAKWVATLRDEREEILDKINDPRTNIYQKRFLCEYSLRVVNDLLAKYDRKDN